MSDTLFDAFPDIYGTHRLTLRGLSQWLFQRQRVPRRIVEFGAGGFSTPLFLDRNWMPGTEYLLSLETNPQWAAEVSRLHGSDSRLELLQCDEEEMLVRTAADRAAFHRFDVALVDGGNHSTRNSIAARAMQFSDFVVLHDAEQEDHLPFVLTQPYYYLSCVETPWTAVMSLTEQPFGTPAFRVDCNSQREVAL